MASWEETSKANQHRISKTRDCQTIAGFLLNNAVYRRQIQKDNMNIRHRRVLAEFGPETRFEIKPLPPAPFRVLQENQFERLKATLLSERLERLWKPELSAHVRRAANEAAALAWVTPYPLLVFPVLFGEKSDAALAVALRQEQVLRGSPELYAV